MFLPSYSLPFSVSVLLMKGLLSLGLPSPGKAEESGVWYQLVVIPLPVHPAVWPLELSEPPFAHWKETELTMSRCSVLLTAYKEPSALPGTY